MWRASEATARSRVASLPALLLVLAAITVGGGAANGPGAPTQPHPALAVARYVEQLEGARFVLPCPDADRCVQFTTHGRLFDALLWQNREFTHGKIHGGDVAGVHTEVDLSSVGWFHGHVVGDTKSHVRMTVLNNEFYGTVYTSNGTYVIDRHLLETGPSTLVYRSDSLDLDDSHTANCAVSGPSEGEALTPLEQELHRRRRAGPPSANHVFCEVFLDADKAFHDFWGGSGSESERVANTIVKMLDVLFQVDGIYALSTNFDGRVRFRSAGAKVLTTPPFTSSTGVNAGQQLLIGYQAFLGSNNINGQATHVRGSELPTSQDVCANHLFTHTNLGGTLGVAIKGSIGDIGGVCETRLYQDRAQNTAFTNTRSGTGLASPMYQTIIAAAHELGHNLGSAHDCEFDSGSAPAPSCSQAIGKDVCVPSDMQGGSFIMYPAVTATITRPNSLMFSQCSLDEVEAFIVARGECFKLPFNGCPPEGTACCAGNSLLPQGTVCEPVAADDPCMEAVCDGSSFDCPVTKQPRAVGSSCSVPGTATPTPGICSPTGTCEACLGGACGAPAPTCQYKAEGLAACTEPCGGGLRPVLYGCVCSDGSRDDTGAACGGLAPRPATSSACLEAACPVVGVDAFVLELDTPATSVNLGRFEHLSRLAVGYPVTVNTLTSMSNGRSRVALRSCRSDQTGCLSREQLKAALTSASVQGSLQAALGFAYRPYEADDSLSSLSIIFIVVGVIAAAVIVISIVYYYCRRRRNNGRPWKQSAAGAGPRSRHRHQSSAAARAAPQRRLEWDNPSAVASQPGSRVALLSGGRSGDILGLRSEPALKPTAMSAAASTAKPLECQVVNAFTAADADELTIRPGDTVVVLSTQTHELGWWRGRVGDRTGLFPQAFVQCSMNEV